MNKKGVMMASFLLGAIFGYLVTNKYLKTMYEKIADEEIESVKMKFGGSYRNSENFKKYKENVDKVKRIASVEGYSTEYVAIDECIRKMNGLVDDEDTEMSTDPYVIPIEQYGEISHYENQILLCYADGVVTYELNERVHHPEKLIGSAWKEIVENRSMVEGCDSICVRNENTETDYEIVFEDGNFSDLGQDGEDGDLSE